VLPYTDHPSSSAHTFCSQCCRPWQFARYKTCDNCRQKALAHKSRSRVLPTTENQGVSTEPADNVRGGFPGRILPASTATRRLAPLLWHHAKRQKIIDAQPRNVDDSLDKALGFLRNEHERHAIASKCFPPEISSTDIRRSVSRHEEATSTASKRSVCSSCGNVVPEAENFPRR
jgi:hypothetical protein